MHAHAIKGMCALSTIMSQHFLDQPLTVGGRARIHVTPLNNSYRGSLKWVWVEHSKGGSVEVLRTSLATLLHFLTILILTQVSPDRVEMQWTTAFSLSGPPLRFLYSNGLYKTSILSRLS
jgi:hypothetical protein